MNVNLLDLFIGIIFIYALFTGYTKGLIHKLSAASGIVLGLYAALNFSSVTDYLFVQLGWDITSYGHVVSFVLTFVLVLLLLKLLGKALESIVSLLGLGLVNKLGGMAFSALQSLLILCLLHYLITLLKVDDLLYGMSFFSESVLLDKFIAPCTRFLLGHVTFL